MAHKELIILVTGCSRGLGFGLVKELLSRGNYKVLATCRNPSTASELSGLLKENGQPDVIPCDVSNDHSIHACKIAVEKIVPRIDILVNNAAISNRDHPDEPPSRVSREEFLEIMSVNVAGPTSVIQTFLPLLQSSACPKVLSVSSFIGSISSAAGVSSSSYRCSKAALNMMNKLFALEFHAIVFTTVHPGWVQTAMGSAKNRRPPVTVDESVKGIVDLLESLDLSKSGGFFDYNGKKLEF